MSEETDDRVEINWIQVSASALAAVSSAVLLSTVGVAGTLIGAAAGSVVATVGSALYSHYLKVTRARVAAAQGMALERVARARAGASGVWAESRRSDGRPGPTTRLRLRQAHNELDHAEKELDAVEERARPPWRTLVAGLPWKRIAAVAAAVFVLAMLVIVSFELVTGRAVSTYTGGTADKHTRTSIPGLVRQHSSGTPAQDTTPRQVPSTDQSATPQTSPSAPSGQRSADSVPTGTPSATSSGTPSVTPTSATTTSTPLPTTAAPTPTPAQTPAG